MSICTLHVWAKNYNYLHVGVHVKYSIYIIVYMYMYILYYSVCMHLLGQVKLIFKLLKWSYT